MNARHNQTIQEIQDNQPVNGVFLVKAMSRAETKNGKPYLTLTLMDATGEITARVWENADQLMDACPQGAVVQVSGQAQSYRGTLQLRIDSLSRLPAEQVDPGRFLPTTKADVKAMARELRAMVDQVADPALRQLLTAFFLDQRFMEAFKRAVAAKAMHHGYLGGLLEHTLGVARLARAVCAFYPSLDRDLLLAGALLHDIGKVREFDQARIPPDYSDQGRLVGHMVLGVEMVQRRIDELPGFPADLATRLKHLIISHHGRHEFGTPTPPMMAEAFVLHFLDDLDAKVNYFERLAGQVSEPGYQWSEYQRNLERFLYLRPLGAAGREEAGQLDAGDDPTVDPRQQRLFG